MLTRLWHRSGTRDRQPSAGHNRKRPTGRLFVEPLEDRSLMAGNVVLDWNAAALAATIQAGNPPPVAARTMAIVHAAVYDAVNAIDQTHEPYATARRGPPDASRIRAGPDAAMAGRNALRPDQRVAVPTGPAPGVEQPRVHGRLQRGQGPRARG